MNHLWAGWRAAYVTGDEQKTVPTIEGQTLFEALLHSNEPDTETLIVHRGLTCFAVLNAYPYNSGHVLVLPNRAETRLGGLAAAESAELWETVNAAVAAVEKAYDPPGINVGLNQGAASGAAVPDHLHVHVVPRWHADASFMLSVAQTRVLPEAIDRSWERIVEAWPA